jgi:hypothetical protein
MSAFSASNFLARRFRRAAWVAAAALTLVALGGGLALAKTRATSRDSSRRVSIDVPAVHIEGSGARVRVGKGIDVEVDEGDSSRHPRRKVVVVGPHVSVDDDGAVVRVFNDVVIDENEQVDGDVVTVFGSSKIDGHITGNAVAVFGSVTLGPRAAVDGDMVAILGRIDRAEGATVGGESVDIGVTPPIPGLPALPTLLLCAALLIVLSIVGGWIVSMVMPQRLLRIAATASRRTTGSVLLGLVSVPLLILSCALLCITVIGIPVALMMPIAFAVVVWIGQYAGAYGLGLKLLRRRLGEGSVIAPLSAGTLFIAAFFVAGALLAGPPGATRTLGLFLVAVGGLFGFALTIIGTGAVLLSRFGSRPRDAVFEPATAPATAGAIAPPAIGA